MDWTFRPNKRNGYALLYGKYYVYLYVTNILTQSAIF